MTMQGVLGASDALTQKFLAETYPEVAAMFATPVYIAAIAYWAIWGMQFLGGHRPLDPAGTLKKVFMTFMVFSMLQWGGMARRIYEAFFGTAEQMGATIMAGENTATMLDALYKSTDTIAEVLKQSDFYQIAMILDGFVLFVLNCILFVIAVGYMMIAKYGLVITMVFLPLFAGFIFFDMTKGWVRGWFSKMMTFSLMYVLVVAIVRMGFFTFGDAIEEVGKVVAAGAHPDLLTSNLTGQLAIVQAVMILFMLGVRGWAGQLGGAAAGSSGALVMLMRGAVGSLKTPKGGKK